MSVALSAALAVWLMFIYRRTEEDVLSGMASAFFWLLCAGASYVYSAGSVADIYFYFFLASIGMMFAMLLEVLAFSPGRKRAKESKDIKEPEKKEEDISENRMDKIRRERGLRPLNRK